MSIFSIQAQAALIFYSVDEKQSAKNTINWYKDVVRVW